MKNTFKIIVILIGFFAVLQKTSAQTWQVQYTNTQVCSGVFVQIVDSSNNPLTTSMGVPNGFGTLLGTCTGGNPAYAKFTEGSCTIQVNLNSTYPCGASSPCTCTCITSGTSYGFSTTSPSCPFGIWDLMVTIN